MIQVGVDLEIDFEYTFKFKKNKEKFDMLWGMKANARQSLKDWLTISTDIGPKTSEVCANACSELIENCIKYSENDSTIVVSIKAKGKSVTVETINRAEKEDKETLAEAVRKLNAASDPKQLFAEKLLNPVEGKSELGLIKIITETKGVIVFIKAIQKMLYI